MKKAVIVGCNGQDGRLLYDLLAARGYRIIGIARNRLRATSGGGRRRVDIHDFQQVRRLLRSFKPREIYYLAAFHHSSEQDTNLDDGALFRKSQEVHVSALLNFLESMRGMDSPARLFYAASSHVFGASRSGRLSEAAPFDPGNIYGITKAAGVMACRYFRRCYSLYSSVGFLFNHESRWRDPSFLSRKIVQGALAVKAGLRDELVLGDLDAEVDWGYAPDYVEAMHAILQLPHPDDFVVATGRRHSVREFVQTAFAELGLDWSRFVRSDPGLLTKPRSAFIGDPSKLRRRTGWKARTNFREMIRALLEAEEQ